MESKIEKLSYDFENDYSDEMNTEDEEDFFEAHKRHPTKKDKKEFLKRNQENRKKRKENDERRTKEIRKVVEEMREFLGSKFDICDIFDRIENKKPYYQRCKFDNANECETRKVNEIFYKCICCGGGKNPYLQYGGLI